MTVIVYDFPREWYNGDGIAIVTGKFRPRSKSQVSPRTWTGGANVNPLTKIWLADITMSPMRDPLLQDMKAFMSQLSGQAGVLRMADASRLLPWYDRNIANLTTATFSDGTIFTDGTGFVSGYLPPEVYLVSSASRGANYIVIGGFPASTTDVIRRGDLLQIMPGGVAGTVPHLYESGMNCSSDAAGHVGISLNIRLRADVAAGDVVSLRYASTLFRLIDDTQGDVEDTGAQVGNVGFSLVEALDLVP